MRKPGVRESLLYILAWLNGPRVFAWLAAHGVVKGGIVEFSEKPLNSIPFRRIRWHDPREVRLHDALTATAETLVAQPDDAALRARLAGLLEKLLGDFD